MGSYKLSKNAKSDLKRLYMRGLRMYGEAQADQYFNKFFERFEQLAGQPLLYTSIDEIRSKTPLSGCRFTKRCTSPIQSD